MYEVLKDTRDQVIGACYIDVSTTLERVQADVPAETTSDEEVIAEAFKQAVEAAKRVVAAHPHLRVGSDV